MEKYRFKNLINTASKRKDAELVYKNITVVDVFTQDLYKGDVAISDGYIVGIGIYEGENEIDGSGLYISPSFIDAHMHLESTLVTPSTYEEAALPHGVTRVIADPHEIANVAGKDGLKYLLEDFSHTTMDFHIMLPSCVPATSLEEGGAILRANDLKDFYSHQKVLGLGEVMDSYSVLNTEDDMLDKLLDAKNSNLTIDGHGAGFDTTALNTYLTAGITTDHECHSPEEVIKRLRRGMYVLMREGTAAKNLRELSSIINVGNSRNICLCTDDKHLDELIREGSIDNAIRIAIEEGIPAPTAIQMATINTAQCYGLSSVGAIAPGYKADFVILSDLETVSIEKVYKDGKLVAQEGKALIKSKADSKVPESLLNSITLPEISKGDLDIVVESGKVNVIEYIPNKLETKKVIETIKVTDKLFTADIERDLLPIYVIDRYTGKMRIGKGIIKGFGLLDGAIGTSISHDSHNIILVGTNQKDILKCLEKLKKAGGGMVYVKENYTKTLKLEVGGLITTRKSEVILEELDSLHSALPMKNKEFNPFLALSFLSLPVIPEIRITYKGLYSTENNGFISIQSS